MILLLIWLWTLATNHWVVALLLTVHWFRGLDWKTEYYDNEWF